MTDRPQNQTLIGTSVLRHTDGLLLSLALARLTLDHLLWPDMGEEGLKAEKLKD